MAQPQKRARLAEVTADTYREKATNQNRFIEAKHLALIESSIASVKNYSTNKSPRLSVTCIQSITYLLLDSLTGNIYNLTFQDAKTVAKSDQI